MCPVCQQAHTGLCPLSPGVDPRLLLVEAVAREAEIATLRSLLGSPVPRPKKDPHRRPRTPRLHEGTQAAKVVTFLRENGPADSMVISNAVGFTYAAVAGIMSRLADRGFVERRGKIDTRTVWAVKGAA